MHKIEDLIKHSPKNIKGKIVKEHVILEIIGEDVHYWSPQLNFRVETSEFEPDTTIVSGLIGPRPAVWTMFMFIYFSVGTIGFFVASYGFSKIMLGHYSNLVLALPIAILFMLSAYQVGKYGERLAKDQIDLLKQFIRDALKNEEEVSNTQ